MGANLLKFRYVVQAAMTIVVLAWGISIHAQVTTGTLRGVVTDQTGAVVLAHQLPSRIQTKRHRKLPKAAAAANTSSTSYWAAPTP